MRGFTSGLGGDVGGGCADPPGAGPRDGLMAVIGICPRRLHGSVGSRSPKQVSARGACQSTPTSSDSPGSVISSVSPVIRAACGGG
jgi:hypothetical protein